MTQIFSDNQHESVEKSSEISKLVLYNDENNDFNYVINTLIEIFGFDEIQATQLTTLVHYKGKMTVKEGMKSQLIPFEIRLNKAGLVAEIGDR